MIEKGGDDKKTSSILSPVRFESSDERFDKYRQPW